MTMLRCVLLIAAAGLAHASSVAEVVATMTKNYENRGSDNNYLAQEVFDRAAYEAKFATKERTFLTSRTEMRAGLRFCAFETEGAYGAHMSSSAAWQLAGESMTALRRVSLCSNPGKQSSSIVFMERITGKHLVDSDIISSPCAVAIHEKSGKVTVVQGASFD